MAKYFKFSREDAILIFDFLSLLLQEAYTLNMNEWQLILCLPECWKKSAAREYCSSPSGNGTDGLPYWPEAVQYFLRTYATGTVISKETTYLEEIPKNANETKSLFASRITDDAYRCGNIHGNNENIIILTKGLLPEVRPIFEQFRAKDQRYSMTFNHVVKFARYEGD